MEWNLHSTAYKQYICVICGKKKKTQRKSTEIHIQAKQKATICEEQKTWKLTRYANPNNQ